MNPVIARTVSSSYAFKAPTALSTFNPQKIKAVGIRELLRIKSKKEEKNLRQLSTCYPKNNEAFDLIHRNRPIRNNDKDGRMHRILEQNKPIKSKQQPKSLKM